MNISSVVVYAEPPELHAVLALMATLPGVQLHAQTPDGKLVVTIEAEDAATAANIYEAIERAEGVLSVALVFQQTESNPEQELAPCK